MERGIMYLYANLSFTCLFNVSLSLSQPVIGWVTIICREVNLQVAVLFFDLIIVPVCSNGGIEIIQKVFIERYFNAGTDIFSLTLER
jgi:hypothetical protein